MCGLGSHFTSVDAVLSEPLTVAEAVTASVPVVVACNVADAFPEESVTAVVLKPVSGPVAIVNVTVTPTWAVPPESLTVAVTVWSVPTSTAPAGPSRVTAEGSVTEAPPMATATRGLSLSG